MKKNISIIIFSIYILLLFSCRTTRLEISTKIYKESLQTERNLVMIDGVYYTPFNLLNKLEITLTEIKDEKISFSDSVYDNLGKVIPSVIKLQPEKEKYERYLNQRYNEIKNDINTIQKNYNEKAIDQKDVIEQVDILKDKIEELGNYTSDYSEFINKSAIEFIKIISADDSSRSKIAKRNMINLERLAKSLKYFGNSSKLDSIKLFEIANYLNENGKQLLEKFGQTQVLYNNIDNLQDLSSPHWRNILKDGNKNWSEKLPKTKYVASGNSSVIIIRENPISYRVHEGINDPTALIRAQLYISRAIANTSLNILGSVYGFNLNAFSPVNTTQNEDKTLALAKLNVTNEMNATIRTQKLQSLYYELENIKNQLKNLQKDDKPKREVINKKLKLILNNY